MRTIELFGMQKRLDRNGEIKSTRPIAPCAELRQKETGCAARNGADGGACRSLKGVREGEGVSFPVKTHLPSKSWH